ncbi:MAG: CBS domain-containing protein, partial [Chromatiales bacterium]|nr:CBS domain-containing protein [Chromatiales bacterium]
DNERAITELLLHSQHTRLPVFRGDIEHIEGVVHLRKLMEGALHDKLTKEAVLEACDEPYYAPLGTPLNTQLFNFQREEERVALVVDEYGDLHGMVTLEDILEQIVGQFTTDPDDLNRDVDRQEDGTYLVDGGASIRELNRTMQWELPTEGPRTVNGLILEHLEAIPQRGTSLRVGGYPIEIMQIAGNAVKTAKIMPMLRRLPAVPDKSKKKY